MNSSDVIGQYLEEVKRLFYSGYAIEHAYRPPLQRLMESFDDTVAVNDPKHSEHGAPDFVFLKKSNSSIIRGYAEAKDITVSLDKTEKTNQMERYAGYTNLFLTDYLEFRFYENGEKYETISLGEAKNGLLYLYPENGARLMRELQAFLDLPPEKITSGRRLAEIMGAKARRIRDNVEVYLKDDSIDARELEKIYEIMKKLLVHDMDEAKFADMYAQTLVYGLFVARYSDDSPNNFTRAEARDLVPASNPFLRHFFDHIAGTGFDSRLAKIVDELCEIFSVSNVQEIVHKHLKIADNAENDAKDPIIHFYEDFLQSYDPAERKRMGAYYTPIPVVRFIIRHIDKILKEDFGIAKGLASTDTITRTIDTQPWRKKGERKDRLTREIREPRVQILDPAVGTATFLNETIKYVYEQNFQGKQEGMWPAYANDNLVPRLFGFELMMAPYTVAHLKLGMTLKELGVDKLKSRLNVFLTNTLEEGTPPQLEFSFGLAEAVAEESQLAAEIKSEKPVMVVMGNPPYSGESSNKTKYAESIVDKYRVEPGGKQKLQEANYKWLGDDYVKFIGFAEDMIDKNGSGVMGMITNNGYLDNPTFRGMRWRLARTYDKIYVLDLHGNAKKKEAAPDGGKDQNIFDIMQGVGIILAVKNNTKQRELAEVYHAELYGVRESKFENLHSDKIEFQKVELDNKFYTFTLNSMNNNNEYTEFIEPIKLFGVKSLGIITKRDKLAVANTRNGLTKKLERFFDKSMSLEAATSLFGVPIKDNDKWDADKVRNSVGSIDSLSGDIVDYSYRPFDNRYVIYRNDVVARPNRKLTDNLIKNNLGLILGRQGLAVGGMQWNLAYITKQATDQNVFYRGGGTVFPLYIYHDDGTRTPNFNTTELSALMRNVPYTLIDTNGGALFDGPEDAVTPEDILDYIYGVLHSPNYREKYKEFLKIDFPRVPAPADRAEFLRFAGFGRQLRELHLMKSPSIDDYDTTYPLQGSDIVEKITREGTNVYINDTQYFGNVPDTAWNFYIGGYQPAQKWLKDRKGRQMTYDDIVHYQRIIRILLETDKVMKQIG